MSAINNYPEPINGIEYEVLIEDRICTADGCGKLMLQGNIAVRRNLRGKIFEHILPLKFGICINCAANALSSLSVQQYERILKQVKHYEDLNDKAEITETEEKIKRSLELLIENLQKFTNQLSSFVEFSDSNPTEYYRESEDEPKSESVQ